MRRPLLRGPLQTDAAAWAYILAAARDADKITTANEVNEANGVNEVDEHKSDADPLTTARLNALVPVAHARYQEIVVPIANNQSEWIVAIYAHCHEFLPRNNTRDLPYLDMLQPRAADPWNQTTCHDAMRGLLIPFTPMTLRLVPPKVIGYQLIPRSSAWLVLRQLIMGVFLDAHRLTNKALYVHMRNAIFWRRLEAGAVQPLSGERFVDAVLTRAPPLVHVLPSRWTAADMTRGLLEALQALLRVSHTRPLADLVEKLSQREYALLVEEHSCLSRVLEEAGWAPNCANGRSLAEYVAFVRFLQSGAADVSLEPVPKRLGRPKLTAAALYSSRVKLAGPAAKTQAPPQTHTAAWACMLATARGADKLDAAGGRNFDKDRLTRARLKTLIPVVRALYEMVALPIAKTEVEKIEAIVTHCRRFLQGSEYRIDADALEPSVKQSSAKESSTNESWNAEECLYETHNLLIPAGFTNLRPAPPEVIAFQLLPPLSVWQILRNAIKAGFSPADRGLFRAWLDIAHDAIRWRKLEKSALEPLRGVRLVDAVLDCAPPLVHALPLRWTAAEMSSELLEAFQALLKVTHTRPLDKLVNEMSERQYALLVEEHACLSQVFEEEDGWAPNCDNGRSLAEYVAFARFLRHEGKFEGSLAAVPPMRACRKPTKKPKRKSSKTRRRKPESSLDESSEPSVQTGELDSEGVESGWRDSCKRQRIGEGPQRDTTPPIWPKEPAAQNVQTAPAGAESLKFKIKLRLPAPNAVAPAAKAQAAPQQMSDGESFRAMDMPLDLDLSMDDGDKLVGKLLRDQLDPVEGDSVEWLPSLPRVPSDVWGNVAPLSPSEARQQLWELERNNVAAGALPKLERPLSRAGGAMSRSDSATVVSRVSAVPLAAAAALGLVVLIVAVVFLLRNRRVVGRQS